MKSYFAFVLPSLLAYALSGIYSIVDGFFVGNAVSDAGLSAINVAYPLVSVIQALGTGIGTGGAVLWAVRKAGGSREEADEYLRGSLILLAASCAAATVLGLIAAPAALRAFGAAGQVYDYGLDYLTVMMAFSSFQILALGMIPVIRNSGEARFAFLTMLAGFLANVFLDWLLVWVFPFGTAGAAYATVAGQGLSALMCAIFLIRKGLPGPGRCRFFTKRAVSIIRIGIAPFGLALTPMLSLMLINLFSSRYGGQEAVATYACIAYAITIVQCLLQGVGDGSQPLLSIAYGKGDRDTLASTATLSYLTGLAVALLSTLALYLARGSLGALFGASAQVSTLVAAVLPLFLVGLVFYSVSRVTTACLYATERILLSYICVYAEPVLLLVLLLILPVFMGQSGVWLSVVLSQCALAVISLAVRRVRGL